MGPPGIPSRGFKSLVRVIVLLNRVRCALEPEGKLLGVSILHLGLVEIR